MSYEVMRYKDFETLKKNDDFQRVYKGRKTKADPFLVVYVLENTCGYNRLGISASKKVGNSIQRNRAKRLMKESYRLNAEKFLEGYDLIFIARNTINGKKQKDVEKSLLNAAKRGKVTGR